VAWLDDKGTPMGQYTGQLSGSICGVKPLNNPPAGSSARPATTIPAAVRAIYLRQFSPSVRK